MTGTVALVVAAGSGSRAGGDVPKQYQSIHGQPMLRHSVAAFAAHPRVDTTAVVIDPTHRHHYDAAIAGLDLPPPIDGGATRQRSCCLGLQAIADLNPARVLIHDAARPFVSNAVIDRVLDALDTSPAVLPALPVSDTLKRANDDAPGAPIVTATIDRAGLWRAQTPQGFAFEKIHAAHLAARTRTDLNDLTDDAAVAEAAGLTVTLVPGDPANEKVTTSEQLHAASSPVTRTGIGFDVHAFTDGDHVTLGGVKIPHDKALSGHSDADVVLHAITDAILGAIAAGDIGDHFPPTDPQWAGADSKTFLRHAADMVSKRGGRVVNVDVTVICEAPRIAPRKDAMRAVIADCLAIQPDAVAVKATTTEGLGFTGRGEGIAAQAIANVAMWTQVG